MSGVNDNSAGKRKLPDLGSKEEADCNIKRVETIKVKPTIRVTYSPTEEEWQRISQGLQPSKVEEFKKWLKSLTRKDLEIGSTHVENLPRKELERLLLSVAKNEKQPKGPPYIGTFFKSESVPLKKGEGL